MSSKNKGTITVIVNGVQAEVEVNEHAPLRTLIPQALRETANSGRPPEDWELRDADGNLLDLDKKIGDFAFPENTKLSLNLKVGAGG